MNTDSVTEVVYHRNGISGNGFHVVNFTDGRLNMVGVVFDEPGSVAVFDRDLLGTGVIEFAYNSWRGDFYEPMLREAVEHYQNSWDPETCRWEWPIKQVI